MTLDWLMYMIHESNWRAGGQKSCIKATWEALKVYLALRDRNE
jgi:hypothetical protein